jgi:hypothetical protein
VYISLFFRSTIVFLHAGLFIEIKLFQHVLLLVDRKDLTTRSDALYLPSLSILSLSQITRISAGRRSYYPLILISVTSRAK